MGSAGGGEFWAGARDPFIDTLSDVLIRSAALKVIQMIDWHAQRHPEDVPTPVAVALADFCRRAKAPASPALVREALAVLLDDDDFRVRLIADADPPARPLGPFAVIDLVRGTSPQLAAQRQETGYYDLVRSVVGQRPAALIPLPRRSPPQPQVSEPKVPRAPSKQAAQKAQALREKIAPRKRTALEKAPKALSPQRAPSTSFLPKHALPAPRGRFTQVDPSRTSVHALHRPDAREGFKAFVDQAPHRFALHKTLAQSYTGRGGQELTVADTLSLLEKHRLRQKMEAKERELLLGAITEQRGALGGVARALHIRLEELAALLKSLRITRETQEIQQRAVREALAPGNLPLRLTLIPKKRYLDDLGIREALELKLQAELTRVINEVRDENLKTEGQLVDRLAKRHGLPPDPLRKALEGLNLFDTYFGPPGKEN